ncbi:uracil-DNA glycosylase-like protein [Collybia nuda]|uniref:Uracil-DNA glycosylase-like protein n=1 Tax=Collybia nuda TaxID=64659 RepID=A0A9P6CGV0_9AGAR|nr:uracil-DNA glycosylase-like protein [Collybia nuda]
MSMSRQKSIKFESDDEDYTMASTAITSFQSSIASFAFTQAQQPRGSQSGRRLYTSILNIPETPKKHRLEVSNSPGFSTPGIPTTTCADVTPRKKRKKVRGYAAPEVYAHLRDLQDILVENLDVVFCGINPGQKSAEIGHHFGHPTNHFWGCLHESGFTTERLPPEEDHTLPGRFSLGLTNLVDRATAEQNELSLDERAASVPTLLTKVARYRPRMLCFIGLGIAKVVQTQLRPSVRGKGAKVEKFKEGLQGYKMVHTSSPNTQQETLFYALPCTSGRVVQPQRAGKVELFKHLKTILDQLKRSELDTDHMYIVSPPEKT